MKHQTILVALLLSLANLALASDATIRAATPHRQPGN